MPGHQCSSDLLIDAHVHFHACFERTAFFDAAIVNFERGALELGLKEAHAACLFYTEPSHRYHFAELYETHRDGGGPWTFTVTGEEQSLIAQRGPAEILVVAGRQIATRDGLEVLALGTTGSFRDGLALHETIERVREDGALPVIPWGFGKWWFARGRLVRDVIESARPGEIFLGDNSGRLRFGPQPRLFDRAAARNIPVLPGSDPLPFPAQVRKPGSYGFHVSCALDHDRPARSIKKHLRALREQPRSYGQLEGPWRFARSQLAMQKLKRRRA